jgi:hypothetical protein
MDISNKYVGIENQSKKLKEGIMKKNMAMFLLACSLVLSTAMSRQKSTLTDSISLKIDPTFGKMPLYFIQNDGQVDTQVAYYIQGRDKTIYFTSEGLTFVLSERGSEENRSGETASMKRRSLMNPAEREFRSPGAQSRWVVKLDFVGATPDVQPSGKEKTEAFISYFRGSPEEWKTGLPTYARIIYRDLWPGIDLVYYGTMDRLKYEFIVHPGADPSSIRLAYRGASSVVVNEDGRLKVVTPAGGFEDDVPVGYQEVEGAKVDVALSYALKFDSSEESPGSETYIYGFDVGDYDRTMPLILDPVVFVYCGFIGGSLWDEGNGIEVDNAGNAYITGSTYSDDFPTTPGAYDPTFNGGFSTDVFITKLNSTGTSLLYSTYLGGSEEDIASAIAVDGNGNAYVTGWTESSDFPTTSGAFDTTYNGVNSGLSDAFMAKLNSTGTSLLYATYLGGNDGDNGYSEGHGIAIDGSGNAYVTGWTESTDFPISPDAFDKAKNGIDDAFVTKINPAGNGTADLIYSTYLGGHGMESSYAIAVDGNGNAYVTGWTNSDNFPTTSGAYDTTGDVSNPFADVYITKLNSTGTSLLYSTYLAGTHHDMGHGIAIDGSGNTYVTGWTNSDNFPTTSGAYDTSPNGSKDAFIVKLNPGGNGVADLLYSTYLGGSADEEGLGIAVDGNGNAYVTGWTISTEGTFPVIVGPDLTYNGDPWDAFVAKVNSSGTALIYCGYIGGSGWDRGHGIALDGAGNVYVTGYTSSTEATFPVTGGPDLTHNGCDDVFVAKISYTEEFANLTVTVPNGGENWMVGTAHNITWTSTGMIANVKIEYSINNASNWSNVIASTANDGSHPWTVPNAPSTACLVRVSESSTGTPADVSNAVFSIVSLTISGTVKVGETPLENVVMTGLPGNVKTNASGQYTGTVNSGWTGTVTPTLAGYTFVPASRTYSNIVAPQPNQDYAYIIDWSLGFRSSGSWTGAGKAVAGWFIGDFNGDGKKDIFRYYPGVSGADMFLSDGTQFNSVGSWTGAGYGSDGWYVGDFNGDGKDDIFRYYPGVSGADMFLSDGTQFNSVGSWTGAGNGSDGWYVGDFNGDGKDDIFRYYPGVSGADMFLSDGTQFNSVGSWTGAGNGSDGWYVGDFNGDGKDDIMRYTPGKGSEVFLSDGTQFVSAGIWTGAGNGADGWYVGDFNGDGKCDIFRYVPGVSGAEVFLSDGTKFVEAGSWTGAGNGTDGWYVGDFNGDGKADIFRYYPGVSGADVFLAGSVSGSVSEFDAFQWNASSSVGIPLDAAYWMEEKWLEPFRLKAGRGEPVSLMDLKQAYENATGEKPNRAVLLRWLKRHDFRLISKE